MIRKISYTFLALLALLVIVLAWRYSEIQKRNEVKRMAALTATTTVETIATTTTTTTTEVVIYETALQHKTDMFKTVSVASGQTLPKGTKLTGEVRGNWYFEASFPVELRNASGTPFWTGVAQAQSDWMTVNFVPFSLVLNYTPFGTPTPATLVLKKDNPSGEPINDDELLIPVVVQ
jgi:hypothetical protein